MKKLFIYVAVISLLTGCFKFTSTQVKEVENKFPNCDVRKIPQDQTINQWLVKTPDNKIFYVYFDGVANLVSIPMY